MGRRRRSAFAAQPVVPAFYPADLSPVGADQMALDQAVMPVLGKHDAQLIAIITTAPGRRGADRRRGAGERVRL